MSVGEFEPVREQAFKIMAFILFFIFPRIDVRKFGKRESQGGWKIAKNPSFFKDDVNPLKWRIKAELITSGLEFFITKIFIFTKFACGPTHAYFER